MQHHYTYAGTLLASAKVNWKIEDIIGGDKQLDFSKSFLPESLARVEPLTFLNAREKLIVNQIRGFDYLCTFGLVEEFILPFVLDHARPQLSGDDHRVRALLQFANEEAKHIHLFKVFREEFRKGFGTECSFIGPAEVVAQAVLAHSPLAVAITIMHIEWMTQRHYLESVRDNGDLDEQFKSLLKHHWMEEAQHAKLDTLMVEALAAQSSEAEIDQGIEEYLEIGGFLDQGLAQQLQFNLEGFTKATGRELTAEEKQRYDEVQRQAIRWTFLGSGMTHEKFRGTLKGIRPSASERVAEVAPVFC